MSWDELVAAALIGTDRRPVEASLPEGSPSGLEAVLGERDPEARLLGAAAAWTVARRAGALPGARVEVTAAPEDPRPVAPAGLLRALLDDTFPSLIPEWLALAAERGLRAPPELVPALLDHATGVPALHAAAGEAAGPLGAWLAERAPRWAFARGAGDDVDAIWADGSRDERRALLERVRARDAAAGRALVSRTFAEETWEDRAAFVTALASGLSGADEPLLETALDDRRKPVRDAASVLLAALPDSAFGMRMAAHTAPLLRVEDGRIVATLPDEPDDAARRDGVPAGGRRSERLRALLAATPLATWTGAETPRAAADAASPPGAAGAAVPRAAASPPGAADAGSPPAAALGASPAAIVALPVADDLAAVVHAGWAEAAIAQRDAGWARALWALGVQPELLLALPHDEAQRLAAAAPDPDIAARALPGPWSADLSRAVIAAIERRRTAGERGQDVAFAGHRLDPALAQEADERLRHLGGRDLWVLCDILGVRAAMLRELS